MLLTSSDAPSQIWQTVLHELRRGALDPKHPFRFLTLATAGTNFPQVRTVVLRELSSSVEFLVYTENPSSEFAFLPSKKASASTGQGSCYPSYR